MNIYEACPTLESEKFIIRLFRDEDCDDLLKVYSDKNALPFFNSDNCDGDNFYYATKERMEEAIAFWHMSYENGWFVRLSVVDKMAAGVIGTVELCLRVSEDAFNHMGILRVDVRSDYEQEEALYDIFALVTPKIVPENTNSTVNNAFMTGEQSYRYYNEFIWKGRYAECISVEETIERMKGEA